MTTHSFVPTCLWCKEALPEPYLLIFDDPTVLLPTCPSCDLKGYIKELILQCAWCGLVLSGTESGRKILKQNNQGSLVPDLSAGDTHTCCEECIAIYFPRTARKRALRAAS